MLQDNLTLTFQDGGTVERDTAASTATYVREQTSQASSRAKTHNRCQVWGTLSVCLATNAAQQTKQANCTARQYAVCMTTNQQTQARQSCLFSTTSMLVGAHNGLTTSQAAHAAYTDQTCPAWNPCATGTMTGLKCCVQLTTGVMPHNSAACAIRTAHTPTNCTASRSAPDSGLCTVQPWSTSTMLISSHHVGNKFSCRHISRATHITAIMLHCYGL